MSKPANKRLGEAMLHNLEAFYKDQPEGPTEIDVCVDTVIAEGWTPPANYSESE